MIIVSGSKRSGTSLWMQMLRAAGFEVLGEAFPANWAHVIAHANPRGFYETRLTAGIYFRTNPDPATGAYLRPESTESHAVKVFAPGVVRTDIAYCDRVIVTMRPWQEYAASIRELRATAARAEQLDESRRLDDGTEPLLEWWADYFGLVRDAALRGYPVHFQSYAGLLTDPERVLSEVFDWLGAGDLASAVACVDRGLYRNRRGALSLAAPELPTHVIEACERLYEAVHAGVGLDRDLVTHLNAAHHSLLPFFAERQVAARRRVAASVLDGPAPSLHS